MKIKTLLLISSFLVSVTVFAQFTPEKDPNLKKTKLGAAVIGVGQDDDCCEGPTADVVRINDVELDYGPGERPGKFEGSFTAPGADSAPAPEL